MLNKTKLKIMIGLKFLVIKMACQVQSKKIGFPLFLKLLGGRELAGMFMSW